MTDPHMCGMASAVAVDATLSGDRMELCDRFCDVGFGLPTRPGAESAAEEIMWAQRCRSAVEWILTPLDAVRASEWADRLIAHFGTMATILSADEDVITTVLGGCTAPASYLKRFRLIMDHAAMTRLSSGPIFRHTSDLIGFLRLDMGLLRVEQMRALFLASDFSLISLETLAVGVANEVPLYPRLVAKRAVILDASGVVLVHNHPGGNPAMSPADKSMTYAVDEACRAVGVRLHDHLVICRNSYSSFRHDNPLWARSG